MAALRARTPTDRMLRVALLLLTGRPLGPALIGATTVREWFPASRKSITRAHWLLGRFHLCRVPHEAAGGVGRGPGGPPYTRLAAAAGMVAIRRHQTVTNAVPIRISAAVNPTQIPVAPQCSGKHNT
jgi:hypothetical protein